MAGKAAILAAIDHLPRVLDPHPYGKGLAFHPHTPAMQHFHGVPGTVPDGENHPAAREFLPASRRVCQKAGQPASLCQDIRDPVAEQDPASQFLNLFPKAPYRVDEPVGSHMGFGLPQDLLRRAAGGKLLKDKTAAGIFDPRIQLAV